MWCLLQAIEGLVKTTHQLKVSGLNKAGGLVSVDRLIENVVEEGVIDV
jgi:hypothetical protein